jgi:hypothetical protein
MTDEDQILVKARTLAIAHFKPGGAREEGFKSGAYDTGTDVTQFLPEAERWWIANRPEAETE